MKNNGSTDINVSISLLEERKESLSNELNEELKTVMENMKPANLIKKAATGIITLPVANIVFKNAAGAFAGYLVRRFIVRSSKGIMRKMTGNIVLWMLRKLIFKI